MAHTKSGGSTRQQGNRVGKRLGVKVFGGQKVEIGSVLVRQRGSSFRPGPGVKMGRDFTLYSVKSGTLQFVTRHGRIFLTVN